MVVRRQCILGGGSYDLLCLQTQHTDVQQRIADLEADIASKQQIIDAQLQAQQVGSCPRCAAMAPVFREVLGQRSLRPSRYSQCWRATGDYNEVRSNAFASLVTHSGGSSRKVGCVVLYVLLFFSVFPLIRCSWLSVFSSVAVKVFWDAELSCVVLTLLFQCCCICSVCFVVQM